MIGYADLSNVDEHDPRFEWVRDPKWLAMPPTASNTIYLLVGVTDDDSNYVAMKATVTGGYTVDWGDGNTENVASGTTAKHKYTFSSITHSIDDSLKQVIVKLTPQTSGNDFTALDLCPGYDNTVTDYQMLLDAQIDAPELTSFTAHTSVTNAENRWLERVVFKSIGAITSFLRAFSYCRSLRVVEFPPGSLQSATNLEGMFEYCYALRFMKFPVGSLGSVTTIKQMFREAIALGEVEFPEGSLGSLTTMYQAFYSCSMLEYIKFPAMPNLTTMEYAFYFCTILEIIEFTTGSFGLLTNMNSAFGSNYGLRRLVNFSVPISFTVPGKMAAEELNEIYTALPTVTSKTITVTGHYGTGGDNPSIATAKGWTVTGS